FCQIARPKIKAEGLIASGTVLGERWRALKYEEKRPYDDMAAVDKARYDREMEVYKANHRASEGVMDDEKNVASSSGGGGGQETGTTAANKKRGAKDTFMRGEERKRDEKDMAVQNASLQAAGRVDSVTANKNAYPTFQEIDTTVDVQIEGMKDTNKKDPNAPKGVPGSFIFYQNEIRCKVLAENPKTTFGEASVIMGQRWKALSEEERRPYHAMRDNDKQRYEKEMAVYDASLQAVGRVRDEDKKRVEKDMAVQNAGLQVAGSVDNGTTNKNASPTFEEMDTTVDVQIRICEKDMVVYSENRQAEMAGNAMNELQQGNRSTAEDEKRAKSAGNTKASSVEDAESDDGLEECVICHEMLNLWNDDVVTCRNTKDCGASVHKQCMAKYDLEPLSEDCIRCCLLEPEEGVDRADTLNGLHFVVDGDHHKKLRKTIKAFGGTIVRTTDMADPEKTTFFVVNKSQKQAKVDEARKHGTPFIGPAKLRLLALEKTTVDQCKAQPPRSINCIGSTPLTRPTKPQLGDSSAQNKYLTMNTCLANPTLSAAANKPGSSKDINDEDGKSAIIDAFLAGRCNVINKTLAKKVGGSSNTDTPQSPMQKSTEKTAEGLDDTPMHAVSVAMKMRMGNRRDSAAGKKNSIASAAVDVAANGSNNTPASKKDDYEDSANNTARASASVTAEISRDSTAGADKENQVNASTKENDDGSAQGGNKKSNMFVGLSKRIMAAKCTLMKSVLPGKKTRAASIAPEKAIATDEIMAHLEAMKESVMNTPQVTEKKIKCNTNDGKGDDCSTASSDDFIWEAGLKTKHSVGRVVVGDAEKEGADCDDVLQEKGDDIDCEEVDRQPKDGGDKEEHEPVDDSTNLSDDIDTACVRGGDKEDGRADSADEETQPTANTSKKEVNAKLPPYAAAAIVPTLLKLIPVSRAACEAILREKGLAYSEPVYLITGSQEDYDIARETITLEMMWTKDSNTTNMTKVVLGRNTTTGIQWSAISRKLCDISLAYLIKDPHPTSTPTAFLSMKKKLADHAVCLDGSELNEPIGDKVALEDGMVISLYGPTGFAYRVEVSHNKALPSKK
ncbi:hypothetical protein ACHAXR_009261, partial [Thalassiosira sp. AJA248-18]